jgi:hypothetical protein
MNLKIDRLLIFCSLLSSGRAFPGPFGSPSSAPLPVPPAKGPNRDSAVKAQHFWRAIIDSWEFYLLECERLTRVKRNSSARSFAYVLIHAMLN